VDNDKELVHKLQQKVDKRKSQFHKSHSKVYNDNLQIEIDTLEWVLEQIQAYTKKVVTTGRVEAIVEAKIKDLEIRMEKTRYIWDTDRLFTKIETLKWVLYVIYAIKNRETLLV
jgi:predicted O-linked N-acetylglucosamine transferase (SPINDLY family)